MAKKTDDNVSKFIELRAKGYSFQKVSRELNVSVNTLVTWEKEYRKQIDDIEAINIQAIIEESKMSNKYRLEGLIKTLEKVNNEIDKKDFSELTLKELLALKDSLEDKLKNRLSCYEIHTGQMKNIMDSITEDQEVTLNID